MALGTNGGVGYSCLEIAQLLLMEVEVDKDRWEKVGLLAVVVLQKKGVIR